VARVDRTFPTTLAPERGMAVERSNQGLASARGHMGRSVSCSYLEEPLRGYVWTPKFLRSSLGGLSDLEWILSHLAMDATPFWVAEPLVQRHEHLTCGPVGDGSRTTFPLPILTGSLVANSEVVFVDGVPQATSAYTVRSAANFVNETTALCDDHTQWQCGQGTLATATGFALDGSTCVKLTPAGASAPLPTSLGYWPVTVGDEYTMLAVIFNAASATYNFRVAFNFLDSGLGFVANHWSSWYQGPPGEWVIILRTTTAPATAAYARIAINRDNVADTDPFYWDCCSISYGDYDRWHLPSLSPYLIEFTSAPSANARVTARAEGKRMTRVRVDAGTVEWARRKGGDAVPGKIRLLEEVE